ncbi:MAG: ribosome biogenesis GTP-binding protein YihA/YsxC, partial [Saprospiraceae bacterium]|nr:ribosome biogenesis GTP-binding protein YihA/YsxC [Saprospiraceae bacterium]
MNNIAFIGSFPSANLCPNDERPEYAFIGRSNVGKSSFINTLSNRNALARVSKQPGKTQSINFFLVDESWFLVDLPGYGYAKVSKKMRAEWDYMVKTYLRTRTTISCIFQLVDISVPHQENDIEF